MSSFIPGCNDLPADLKHTLNSEAVENGLSHVISALLAACREIGTVMRNGQFSHEEVGTTNSSGDDQLHVDIATEEIVFNYLKSSGVCIVAASEETPEEIDCGAESGYSVGFDPLDGSSIIDANFAVGTICGIWPGRGLLNRTGREQSASMIVQYGPRVTAMVAINRTATQSGEPVCMELTMLPDHWIITHHKVQVAPKCKTFAPGNLRAIGDNANYKTLVDYWIQSKYTLRYSGGLVPDVYHILTKGQGVLSNAASPSAKAKLRLLFECAPVALVVECAGGSSSVAPCEAGQEMTPTSMLDVSVSYLDKRVGACFGSKDEVDRFQSHIFSS
mmetsp:Transcript_15781/g.23725  ORF Transcript_15781/g.23725 Transcript_15781/m.23725 type:complete len:332 (+) Transcript_15781:73-1068(+)